VQLLRKFPPRFSPPLLKTPRIIFTQAELPLNGTKKLKPNFIPQYPVSKWPIEAENNPPMDLHRSRKPFFNQLKSANIHFILQLKITD